MRGVKFTVERAISVFQKRIFPAVTTRTLRAIIYITDILIEYGCLDIGIKAVLTCTGESISLVTIVACTIVSTNSVCTLCIDIASVGHATLIKIYTTSTKSL